MTITAIGNGTIDVQFGSQFPVGEGLPLCRMMVWDVAKDRLTGGSAYNPEYTVLAPQTLRIRSGALGGKLGDVAMIIHGFHARPAIFLKVPLWYTHAGVLDDYDAGDTIELVARDTLKPERTYKEVAVTPFPKEWRQELTLDDALPADTGKYYLVNATRFPRVEMARCTMHSHLARSVLMKTRDVLIEDCTFNQCTGTAIHVGAEGDWKESGPCDRYLTRHPSHTIFLATCSHLRCSYSHAKLTTPFHPPRRRGLCRPHHLPLRPPG